MSQSHFFYDTKAPGNSAFGTGWIYLPFGFLCRSFIILVPWADNTDDFFYSWDGQIIAGRIQVSMQAINLSNKRSTGIYLKSNSGTQNAMITAY